MPQDSIQQHIDLIARHEAEHMEKRTSDERAADAIAGFAGSFHFVLLHLGLFAAWAVWNTARSTRPWHFDPYPFPLFDTVVALEAILLASFILMRQARIGRRSDEREHLMLQVLLLTEKETTALLQVNREIAQQLGLRHLSRDPQLAALSKETSIEDVADTIRESLADET